MNSYTYMVTTKSCITDVINTLKEFHENFNKIKDETKDETTENDPSDNDNNETSSVFSFFKNKDDNIQAKQKEVKKLIKVLQLKNEKMDGLLSDFNVSIEKYTKFFNVFQDKLAYDIQNYDEFKRSDITLDELYIYFSEKYKDVLSLNDIRKIILKIEW